MGCPLIKSVHTSFPLDDSFATVGFQKTIINRQNPPSRDAIAKKYSLLYTRNSIFCKVILNSVCSYL